MMTKSKRTLNSLLRGALQHEVSDHKGLTIVSPSP